MVRYDTFGIAPLLITYGANIEARTLDGETPLHFAAKYGHIAILSLLLERGTCITALDHDGRTPRQACIANHPRTLEQTLFLLDAEATRRARCEAVAMGLMDPNSTLNIFPNELLRMLLQDGIGYDGHGSESDSEGGSGDDSEGDSGGDSEGENV